MFLLSLFPFFLVPSSSFSFSLFSLLGIQCLGCVTAAAVSRSLWIMGTVRWAALRVISKTVLCMVAKWRDERNRFFFSFFFFVFFSPSLSMYVCLFVYLSGIIK
ncbi:hypothetical protein B0T19DRAFT_419468 [Cercophora scortea]|uniref:NADH dehydrogenase subunit 1 n=1 Tax=Cercophora scortea TaxID=314031 RepID=A0AAE0J0J5_9PEZI|nr:hypothetical protein B0T19DRAFT_419468 [Cercophora scortea]